MYGEFEPTQRPAKPPMGKVTHDGGITHREDEPKALDQRRAKRREQFGAHTGLAGKIRLFLRAHPGSTIQQLHQAFPDFTYQQVYDNVKQRENTLHVLRTGSRRGSTFTLTAHGHELAELDEKASGAPPP